MSHNKMLIDATHPEETRVVVLRDGRVEEFDYESAARKLLRGNIYLAKVTRVEPSLQAAFIDYGGNRHGFLAFNEIHPDYYQIPVADRKALLEEEAAAEAAEEAAADAHAERLARRRQRHVKARPALDEGEGDRDQSGEDFVDELVDDLGEDDEDGTYVTEAGDGASSANEARDSLPDADAGDDDEEPSRVVAEATLPRDERLSEEPDWPAERSVAGGLPGSRVAEYDPEEAQELASAEDDAADDDAAHDDTSVDIADAPAPIGLVENEAVEEVVNGAAEPEAVEQTGSEDALEELPERPRRRPRSYKIQEVIKRRQVVLVQVVKEERGNKGAALTTYLSLAGRYTVLMPNTARGGGISRKITNPQDRKRLKAIAAELDVPEGMGLIIRTAGAARTRQEIKRDYEYLLRLWESVRDLTLQSTAPSLVYEEGNLIKRSIRDLYNKDVEEIVVAGEHAQREAKDFMRMLMPSHAKNVILHTSTEPLFNKYGIERQLNAMFSPFVTLRSGGYLVINQTEALVAIDVNSGKSTREFSIEETAHNTNLEAADEIARQLKLRDLAGLIVIDFIDMEEKRNNRSVERRLKDALRFDRARIQLGRISHFGLMEMSRQRMRTGVLEGSTSQCPHCQGTGIIRSTESVALAVLRGLEDALMSGRPDSLIATTTAAVALYILNNKRRYVIEMEARHGVSIAVQASDKLQGANFTIEKGAARTDVARRPERSAVNMDWGFEGEDEPASPREAPTPIESHGDDGPEDEEGLPHRDDGGRGRRRRRRRGRRNGERDVRGSEGEYLGKEPSRTAGHISETYDDGEGEEPLSAGSSDTDGDDEARGGSPLASGGGEERNNRRRRRGRRGGRRGRERGEVTDAPDSPSVHVTEEMFDDFASAVPFEDAGLDGLQPAGATPRRHHDAPETVPDQAPPVGVSSSLVSQSTNGSHDVAAEVVAEAAGEETAPGRRRHVETTGEPRLERVILGPDQPNPDTIDEEAARPARRGWWQRRLSGE